MKIKKLGPCRILLGANKVRDHRCQFKRLSSVRGSSVPTELKPTCSTFSINISSLTGLKRDTENQNSLRRGNTRPVPESESQVTEKTL